MSNFNDQLERMKSLMNYGKVNEETNTPKNYTLEYHATAADGKTYGIVRECNKYYIKRAEDGKELMAESYKYLGGFGNKKDYEYFSYANALKQFELKMASINEACEGNVNVSTLNPFRANAVIAEGTDKMRDEIARQRQIMYNASVLMNESTEIGATPFKTQPEAAHENSEDKDAPFTKEVKADMEFDGEKSSCPKCEGEPFGAKGKTTGSDGKDVQVDDSVAGKKPSGGKVVRVNESLEDESGVYEAGDEDEDMFDENDFADDEEGLGDEEGEEIELDDEEGDLGDEEGELGDEEDELGDEEEFGDEDFEDDELGDEEVDETDPESIRAEIERLQGLLDDLEGEEDELGDEEDELGDEEAELEGEEDAEEELGDEEGAVIDEEDELATDTGATEMNTMSTMNESKRQYMNSIIESVVNDILNEDELHVFGDHPGYRKKPMDLPQTGEDKNQWGEDWNDESVHGEEPFGSQKGDSTPFEDEVEKITNQIMESIKEGKIDFIKKK